MDLYFACGKAKYAKVTSEDVGVLPWGARGVSQKLFRIKPSLEAPGQHFIILSNCGKELDVFVDLGADASIIFNRKCFLLAGSDNEISGIPVVKIQVVELRNLGVKKVQQKISEEFSGSWDEVALVGDKQRSNIFQRDKKVRQGANRSFGQTQ